MTRRALRSFWWLYWPLIALYAIGTVVSANGPLIERAVAPSHADMKAVDIVRTPDRLCWTYAGRKLRRVATDDLDTFLYSAGMSDRMVVSPYGDLDGLPWRKGAAPGVGEFAKRWCIALPNGVPDDRALRFELTAYYAGFLGQWRVPVPWPPVAADGLPAVPGASGR